MAYIDTSALVAYYCPEPMSDKVERTVLSIDTPYISYLTDVEIASAIARKVRCQEISPADGHRIINLYRVHVDKRLYRWLPLDLKNFQVARSWISQFNIALRTRYPWKISQSMLRTTNGRLDRKGRTTGS